MPRSGLSCRIHTPPRSPVSTQAVVAHDALTSYLPTVSLALQMIVVLFLCLLYATRRKCAGGSFWDDGPADGIFFFFFWGGCNPHPT